MRLWTAIEFFIFTWGGLGWVACIFLFMWQHSNNWHLGTEVLYLGLSSVICWIPMMIIDEISKNKAISRVMENVPQDRVDMVRRMF